MLNNDEFRSGVSRAELPHGAGRRRSPSRPRLQLLFLRWSDCGQSRRRDWVCNGNGISPTAGELVIETARDQTILIGPTVDAKPLRLRSEWGLDGVCRFFYSIDGQTFEAMGPTYQFGWADYRGERIGLFSYNNAGQAGYADFGSFTYRFKSPLTRRLTSNFLHGEPGLWDYCV